MQSTWRLRAARSAQPLGPMRGALRQLKDGEYWTYGPAAFDLGSVVDLLQKYSDYADACVERMTTGSTVAEEFADAHAEVSLDVRYYNYLEKGMLWSFGLWRLQGMFEAMIVAHYLPVAPTRPLVGLRAKLAAAAAAGYALTSDQKTELLAWGNLRNLLSHMPPEQFHPIAIDRQDIEEYVGLLQEICTVWSEHRAHGP